MASTAIIQRTPYLFPGAAGWAGLFGLPSWVGRGQDAMRASLALGRETVIGQRLTRAGFLWAAAGRFAYGLAALQTSRPATMVWVAVILAKSSGGTVKGSRSRMTMSASLPGSMVPRWSSANPA